MKSFCCMLIALCCVVGSVCHGQPIGWKPVYTSTWGHLLASPDDSLSALGVFCTEASVMVLDSTEAHYKVRVSNGDVGYIAKQPLATGLFSKRAEGEPAHYFYRGAAEKQAPHQFVKATDLRVREEPNTTAKILRKATINEMVFVDYIPLYPNGWVYIGDHFHEEPAYVQAKFLGEEVRYEQLLADYLKVRGRDAVQELTLVERLRALGWKERQPERRIEALTHYKRSWTNAGRTKSGVDIDFELLVAKKIAGSIKDHEEFAVAFEKLDMHYRIRDIRLADGKITDKQMRGLGMQRIDSVTASPDCGWEPAYFYESPALQVAFEGQPDGNVLGSVLNIQFAKGEVALILDRERIDKHYDERDFVTKFGHLLVVDWIREPHVYKISNGEVGTYLITFKNGRPVDFLSIYFC